MSFKEGDRAYVVHPNGEEVMGGVIVESWTVDNLQGHTIEVDGNHSWWFYHAKDVYHTEEEALKEIEK